MVTMSEIGRIVPIKCIVFNPYIKFETVICVGYKDERLSQTTGV